MTDYDAEFYDYIDMGAFVSANEVLPKLWSEIGFKPKSMIDVGCGTGAWLKVAQALGINDVVGVDGDYNHHAPVTLGSSFQEFDLAKPFESSRKFDLAITLEVAEHLREEYADQFVDSVTSCSDTILWSAAVPGQRGLNHYNEQWPSYWIPKLMERGYFCNGVFRFKLWYNDKVETWYKQNILIFSKNHSEWNEPVRDLIHPNNYPNYPVVEEQFKYAGF